MGRFLQIFGCPSSLVQDKSWASSGGEQLSLRHPDIQHMKRSQSQKSSRFWIKALVLLVPFLLFVAVACYMVFGLHFLYGDALSRTFHAYAVFFGNDPKLAAIGLVWPPVPTLVQLPFVLIAPLNTYGIAGNLTSALFMAGTLLVLYKVCRLLHVGVVGSLVLVALCMSNPMILFYGSNGMSEAVALFFYMLSIYYLVRYLSERRILPLINMGMSVGLAIMSRWEMVVLAIVCAGSIAIAAFLQKTKKPLAHSESRLLIYGSPVAFAVAVWLMLNMLIMGDPLHFMKSVYSNTAQSANLLHENNSFARLQGNLPMVAGYVAQRVFYAHALLFPLMLLVAGKTLFSGKKILHVALVAIPSSVILFHLLLLYKGQSFGWLRFFIYAIPSTYVLIALLVRDIGSAGNRRIVLGVFGVLAFVSNGLTLQAMADVSIGREENKVVNAVLSQDTSYIADVTYDADVAVAEYILHNTKGRILVDDFTGFPIIYYTRRTDRFVETIDDDFEDALHDPAAFAGLRYVLVRNKGGVGDLDAINRLYPTLYEDGAGISTLEKDFGVWRLYRLKK
jgi:hypothetical protein